MVDESVDWESRYKDAAARATESEKNMVQAASFGNILLKEKEELEKEASELREKLSALQYNGSLKEETHFLTLKSLESENEGLRRELSSKEDSWAKEREALKGDLRKARRVQQEDAEEKEEEKEDRRIESMQEEIHLLKKELSSVYSRGDSFREEELDPQEVEREREELQQRLALYKEELEKLTEAHEEVKRERSTLKHELQEKDDEILCYLESLDSARNSAQDLHQKIECLELGETDIKKGNSLFSEVEDRRNFVEQKLQVLQAKNTEMKKIIDEKSKQIHKVKIQNLALLNLGGSAAGEGAFSGGSKSGSGLQVQRLESQLSKEKQMNKSLRDNLELMSSSSSGCEDGQKKVGGDYAYLSSLLQEKANQIEEFKKQLQSQIRQTLEESDKVQDLSRKLNLQENQTVRLKAEVYQLKMMIEDLRAGKQQTHPVSSKTKDKNKVRVEHITFEEEKDQGKAAKELHVLEGKKSLYELEDNKENDSVERMSQSKSTSTKKSVSMCQTVTVIDEDQEEELKNEKLHKALPRRRTPKEQNAISVEERDMEMKEKCAQQ